MDGGAAEWLITDEFAQRLGCGVLTAGALPVWFLLLLLAVDSAPAVIVTAVLFVLTVGFALAAVRRTRRLPRVVRVDGDDVLSTVARSGVRALPLSDLRGVDIGTSLGVWPIRLTFHDGTVLRLPRELDDLEGFLATLRQRRPDVAIVDHNPPDRGAP